MWLAAASRLPSTVPLQLWKAPFASPEMLMPMPTPMLVLQVRGTGSAESWCSLLPPVTMVGQGSWLLPSVWSGLALPCPFAGTGRCPSRQGKGPTANPKRAWQPPGRATVAMATPRRQLGGWAGDQLQRTAPHRTAVSSSVLTCVGVGVNTWTYTAGLDVRADVVAYTNTIRAVL
jgi:hypothetical protein